MATLKTTDVKHAREDLGTFISMISPEETPFRTEIGRTKAKGTYHETLSDELDAPNKNNAAAEGADAALVALSGPVRTGNWTQIFTKDGAIAGTVQAVDLAGTKNEKARQIAKKGLELNRDIEAALISSNASVASGARKLGGAEAS
ncbi:MAG: head protein, partial [Proteobacteria bacterium]